MGDGASTSRSGSSAKTTLPARGADPAREAEVREGVEERVVEQVQASEHPQALVPEARLSRWSTTASLPAATR
jgi:hypothetical protein